MVRSGSYKARLIAHVVTLPRWSLVLGFLLAELLLMFASMIVCLSTMKMGKWRQDELLENIIETVSDAKAWLLLAAIVPVLLVLQGILLLPVARPRPLSSGGWRLWMSMTTAGLLAGLLVLGAGLIILALEWVIVDPRSSEDHWFVPLIVGGVAWLVFTPMFVRFARGVPAETVLSKVTSRLFLGTAIEFACIIPLDVMIRRRTDCYCGGPSFWAIPMYLGIGLVAMGPAAMLPILSRRRKRYFAGRCEVCGYDMSGTPDAARCPECGAGWKGSLVDVGG